MQDFDYCGPSLFQASEMIDATIKAYIQRITDHVYCDKAEQLLFLKCIERAVRAQHALFD